MSQGTQDRSAQRQGQSGPLNLIRCLLKNAVRAVEQDISKGNSGGEAQGTLQELVDWIVVNWMQMSEQVRSSRAVFDLCQSNGAPGAKSDEQLGSDGQMIALHTVT